MTHPWHRFAPHVEQRPDHPALEAEGQVVTYAALADWARRLSAAIREARTEGPFVGVMAGRGPGTYAALLGIGHAGKGHVPLPSNQPPARLRAIAANAQLRLIIADKAFHDDALRLANDLPLRPSVIALEDIGPDHPQAPADPMECTSCYMLHTSGSTGEPKGVPIGPTQLEAYLRQAVPLIGASGQDRFSQLFELGFDLSMHDLWVCWSAGATLCVPSDTQRLAPAAFVRDATITQWFSVPSVALLMDRMRQLKPGSLPTLRTAAFCGEALPVELALRFAAAAPHARILNLYGPTETTIAITAHQVERTAPKALHGIVSIGKPFTGTPWKVLDEGARPAQEGELVLGGAQLTPGYWQAPDRDRSAFLNIDDQRYYRTGDRVRIDEAGDLYFLGRTDHQVKVRGHRLELAAIDHVLRSVSGASFACTIPHPVVDGIATGLVSFLPEELRDEGPRLLQACAHELPPQALPSRLVFLDRLPLTANGKVDRHGLASLLTQRA